MALDYTSFGNIEKNFSTSLVRDVTVEHSLTSVGLSGYYDFHNVNIKGLTPYVGARIAKNDFEQAENGTMRNGSTWSETFKADDVGYGVMVGVQYQMTPNLLLDAGLEYHDLGEFDYVNTSPPFDYTQYGINIGARFNF